MHICNIVNLYFSPVNCVAPPNGSIRYWLPSSPPSSLSVVKLLRLDSWYFVLCPGLGVSSSFSITLFYFFAFALLCHDLLFALAYVRVTNNLIGPISKRCFTCYSLQGCCIITLCDYPARDGGVTLGVLLIK
jgi:hypothetical protein